MAHENKLIDSKTKNTCRNCDSVKITTTRSGFLAFFFLKRVFELDVASVGEEIEVRLRGKGFKKNIVGVIYFALRRLPVFKQLFNIKPYISTDIRICKDCGFIGPEQEYPYSLLHGIYHDYRSDSYNRDRCTYEPDYKKIQMLVGKDGAEVQQRLESVDDILKKYTDISKIRNVLDWGGGEGRFIPTCLLDKEVVILDVSNEPLINSRYLRVSEPPELRKFDFIQVCHVLEHVSAPVEFMKNIMKYSSDEGFTYVEVPQDRSDEDIEQFQHNPIKMRHGIHEHLNLYSEKAVSALGKALGLEVICVEKKCINSGWHKGIVISGLFANKK